MKDQIQRSATSIASNIAEWNDRQSDKEFIRYLIIARGSTSELKTQLYIIEEDIPKDTFTELLKEIIGIHKMLNSFIKTLNK
jgi:four helix bundle protein